jgi:hypothetical protein
MSQEPTTRYSGQLDDLLADQLAGWLAGVPTPVEDYLRRHPGLGEDRQALLALILAEVSLRIERGDRPEVAEYATRFPTHEAELRQNWALLQKPRTRTGNPTTLSARPSPAERPPPALPGFTWLRRLGKGGMGAVYLAHQEKMARDVAVKFILPHRDDAEGIIRFEAEVRAAGGMNHPGVVTVHETGVFDGLHYLVMEYLPCGSLAEKLATVGPLPIRDAANLVREIAVAVQAVHEKKIVHRDLKPGNVLFSREGRPKVADFGLAKHQEDGETLTSPGAAVGTPDYMSPEQALGRPGRNASTVDVWALGCILYACLAGRPPFKGPTHLDTLSQACEKDPEPLTSRRPEVPEELEAVCLKCLQKEPKQRYGTAGALAKDLGHWLAGEPTEARPLGMLGRAMRWVRENPRRAFLAAALAAAPAALGGWWMWGRQPVQAPTGGSDEEKTPKRHFEPGVWYEMLERAPLREVVKPDGAKGDWWKHDPQKHELWMSSNDWGVLELAQVDAEGFDIEMVFEQPRWSGGVAIVWGGRDLAAMDKRGNWGEFLLLAQFDAAQGKETVPLQKGFIKYLKWPSTFLADRTRSEHLHRPQEGARKLEITVDGKGVRRVLWDGQPAKGRLLGWQDEARGRSVRGAVGVMIRKSGVTIQSVRLRVHPKLGEKHE